MGCDDQKVLFQKKGIEVTYNELLEKWDNTSIDIGSATTVWKALRAVIELHKPATADSFTNNDCMCMLPNKKCATIQAIEKVLNG